MAVYWFDFYLILLLCFFAIFLYQFPLTHHFEIALMLLILSFPLLIALLYETNEILLRYTFASLFLALILIIIDIFDFIYWIQSVRKSGFKGLIIPRKF